MFVCVGVISWRLSSVQILNRSFFQNEGNNRTIRTVPLEASRGLILDRNGEPLAVSTPLTSIGINLKNTKLDRSEIQALADGLGLNGDVLANRIQNNLSMSRNFIYVKRHLPPADATRVLDLGVPGVESRTEYQRFYPQGEVAAHIVGFSNVDDVGQEGPMKTGRHLQCPNGTPISNAWLSIARHMGLEMNRFSNSTGTISRLFT